ncbi:MAG: Methyltransferase type 11 [Verrucomicrobiales bacterium]|nr:Methyltransferase type 11 [Verrucomicrobiales bacterium]
MRGKYAVPASPTELADPLSVIDQCGWLKDSIRGRRLLCLGAGGGRHSALFAKLGAKVTVLDISGELLQLDRKMASELHLDITTVEGSIDDLSALPSNFFEVVLQPVSSCYVPSVRKVFQEVARVITPGGLYVSQHKQPASLQSSALLVGNHYSMQEKYKAGLPLPVLTTSLHHREAGMVEFLHTLEELIGGICQSGFVVEDLAEPRHADETAGTGTPGHRAIFLPPFVKIKARRVGAFPSGSPIIIG